MSVRLLIVEGLPWVLSAVTVYQSLLVGDKKLKGWVVAMCNQSLWSVWVVVSATWGFVPLNIALWAVYIRNYRRWKREQARE